MFSLDDVLTAMGNHKEFFPDDDVAAIFRGYVAKDLLNLQIEREGEGEVVGDDLFPAA